ncbi:MAG TPA: type II toxin-antitoxin system prevent-host-death family antitoxin [Thermoflexales bacterium]|nr:type II toxin-antitoxin system prevent-host-death family antitoxin [Thermoflexales bacterium]HQX10936.1 type II toxin-antitoxin system prevent-host-death family antitoxin [Thermoflexales bacterium]HQY24471.1 type II toxin-antitoxin system prevent-host-death family antitoxin [Thermoflexales bacterium]HQZ54783.1 type II toxin-antitoxin system prevent-host-death family antitoxin [Thermoflexales bacterium]HRA54997.1 type II toxin-antitoxin system prevent-host-death family antitoxin [Thermoflexal
MAKQKPPTRPRRVQEQRSGTPGVVGIRELKARASAIVAEVREDRVSYEITRRGQVEALLLPVGPGGADSVAADDAAWDAFQFLADELGRAAEADTPRSAVEELQRMRR